MGGRLLKLLGGRLLKLLGGRLLSGRLLGGRLLGSMGGNMGSMEAGIRKAGIRKAGIRKAGRQESGSSQAGSRTSGSMLASQLMSTRQWQWTWRTSQTSTWKLDWTHPPQMRKLGAHGLPTEFMFFMQSFFLLCEESCLYVHYTSFYCVSNIYNQSNIKHKKQAQSQTNKSSQA
jgi:hypothetical protein